MNADLPGYTQDSHDYIPLSSLPEGVTAEVALLSAGRGLERKLADLGIRVGVSIEVVRRIENGPLLVAVGETRVAIGAGMADKTLVRTSVSGSRGVAVPNQKGSSMNTLLKDLAVGESGRVLGFLKGSSDYRKKLLALGVTPGTPFSVTRVAPLGDPVEILVRGFLLTLRKDETAVLLVERAA